MTLIMKQASGISTVGIVGAGVIGRLLALKLSSSGMDVTLWDQLPSSDLRRCSAVAAGMLAPYCELDSSEKLIFELGTASLELWPLILRELEEPVFFQREGTLVVSHPLDLSELERFQKMITSKIGERGFREVSSTGISVLEPEIDRRFFRGVYFPFEGQIDTRQFLASIDSTLKRRGVKRHYDTEVTEVVPHRIQSAKETQRYDWVLDCRGIGAKNQQNELRSVRGEIIALQSAEIRLNRPVRLIHPRYPLYIVPRPSGEFLVGATSIESHDTSPISVRTVLELLSGAFALNSSFGEARLIETRVGIRPAFPDNLPRVQVQKGLMSINGLYRHGYLISPQIAKMVCNFIFTGEIEDQFGVFSI